MVSKRVQILSIPIDPVTRQEALAQASAFIRAGTPHQIATVNPEFIVAACRQPAFRRVLQATDLNVADGAGIRGAATFLALPRPTWQPLAAIVGFFQGISVGISLALQLAPTRRPIPETVPGIDLVEALSQQAAANGWGLYLLGEDPGVAAEAAAVLRTQYPGLRIVGAEEGLPKGSVPDDAAVATLVGRIKRAKPDILFVAFGAPKQDLFIATHKQALGVPVMMGVGGSFNFLTGRARRAPKLFQQLGLEWLWRVATQPWRLPRILTATVVFPWQTFQSVFD